MKPAPTERDTNASVWHRLTDYRRALLVAVVAVFTATSVLAVPAAATTGAGGFPAAPGDTTAVPAATTTGVTTQADATTAPAATTMMPAATTTAPAATTMMPAATTTAPAVTTMMPAATTSSAVANVNTSIPCNFDKPGWRDATTIEGVAIEESRRCIPDNPYGVATAVRGTNNVDMMTMMKSGYNRNAVRKTNDRDGDGDPDVIRITLEITGINERNETDVNQQIAPGVSPSFWTFSPKSFGMVAEGAPAERNIRMPSTTIRVEQGDTVYVTVENTHYFPHTIHLHGTDHPYEVEGKETEGNDGVPQSSEKPIMPGEERTYKLTPRQPGTMFYHCHVVPNVHISMGLNGLFVIEENRDDNWVQTFNLGAGKVRHPSQANDENYDGEYDLVYQSAGKEMHTIPKQYDDTRRLAYEMNRDFDLTDESADYFLLNGRSFPFTLWQNVVNVEPDSEYRLRMMNSGGETISIHTHGHHFREIAYDGVRRPDGHALQRDVVSLTTAQRVDIVLDTTDDGLNAYGPGAWIFHDHREQGVTTDGVSPGGTVSMITYPEYRDGIAPEVNVNLTQWFDEDYYEREDPYWDQLDEDMFGSPPGVTVPSDGDDPIHGGPTKMSMNMEMNMTEDGWIFNENEDELPPGCDSLNGTRSITVKGGQDYAEPGEAFSYSQQDWQFDKCTKVTVTFENDDAIRHQWMVHGLPHETNSMGMFNIEVSDNGTVTGSFVTPGEDETLNVHCSLPQHEQKGMHGDLVIGDGGHGDEHSLAGVGVSGVDAGEGLVAANGGLLAG